MSSAFTMRILVLAGGPSAEREISLKSGQAVFEALKRRGHDVYWHDPRDESLDGIEASDYDVAFLALHGRYGEDGTVQSQLEVLGLPYTGSDPLSSSLAFCKSQSKRRFRQRGIPTPAGIEIHRDEATDSIIQRVQALSSFAHILVIKPDRQGSSLGVGFAATNLELANAIDVAFSYDESGLIEAAIPGEEWTVPFLDSQALPPIRIGTSRPFFDFEAKYLSDETLYEFPEASAVTARVKDVALRSIQALGVTGLSRVDLRVDPAGQPWVLEVNTIPGLTDHSLTPKAAAHAGIRFPELCEVTCLRAIESFRCRRHDPQIANDTLDSLQTRQAG